MNQGAPADTSRTEADTSRTELALAFVVVSGVLIGAGSLAPWLETRGLSGGNAFHLGIFGALLISLGVLTVVVAISSLPPSPLPHLLQRSSIVTGIASSVVMGAAWPQLHPVLSPLKVAKGDAAWVGFGYWMCGVGVGVAVIGGIALPRAKQ